VKAPQGQEQERPDRDGEEQEDVAEDACSLHELILDFGLRILD
jgi:hypothetical protein